MCSFHDATGATRTSTCNDYEPRVLDLCIIVILHLPIQIPRPTPPYQLGVEISRQLPNQQPTPPQQLTSSPKANIVPTVNFPTTARLVGSFQVDPPERSLFALGRGSPSASCLLCITSPDSSSQPSCSCRGACDFSNSELERDWLGHEAESNTEISIKRPPTFATVPPSESSLVANQPARYSIAAQITL